MPGRQVRDWDRYHALREQGMSKEKAARIANAMAQDRPKRRRRGKRAQGKN